MGALKAAARPAAAPLAIKERSSTGLDLSHFAIPFPPTAPN